MEICELLHASFKNAKQKAVINLKYTSNYISHIQNGYMSKYDLSMPQFNILRILRGAKGVLSVNEVKNRMIEKSPNSTRLMDKLIDKNLIQRIRCEKDKRIVYVSITELGLQVLKEIDEDENSLIEYSGIITEKEAEQLSQLLDKLRG